MRVTKLSDYDDPVWDFSLDEPSKGRCLASCRVDFRAPALVASPALLPAVKKYLWDGIKGGPRRRPVTWGTAVGQLEDIVRIAHAMEDVGLRQWSEITPQTWSLLVAMLYGDRYRNKMFGRLRKLMGLGKSDHALFPLPAKVKEYRQTEPIPDSIMERLVALAMSWEEKIPELMRLKRRFSKDDQWAAANGITNLLRLKHAISCAQGAGMVLLLAATGMRVSELLSLKKGDGRHADSNDPESWYARGTVYKFNGIGRRTQWFGGSMGELGYQMLCALSPAKEICVTHFNIPTPMSRYGVEGRIKLFLREDNISVDGEALYVHPHQFRRTFSRAITVGTDVTQLALKDQFQHKSIDMTDHYAGSDPGMFDAILKENPEINLAEIAECMAAELEEGMRL